VNEDLHRIGSQNPKLKSNAKGALVQATEAQRRSPVRIKVRIISFRARLLDKDNLTGGAKSLADALVRTGLLPDDSPEHIDLTVEQIKVSGNESRTLVEIDYP
jgi:hypothetical protein